jgi:streptogramin lyase
MRFGTTVTSPRQNSTSACLAIGWTAYVCLGNPASAAAPPAPGTIVEYDIPTPHSLPLSITAGPDGNLWFTENQVNKIGRITPDGVFTEFPLLAGFPRAIITGPDGLLWFTEGLGGVLGRMNTSGKLFPLSLGPPSEQTPPDAQHLTVGPDGNVWITEPGRGNIGRLTPGGEFAEFPIPGSETLANYITAGPDGNVWFTCGEHTVGRVVVASGMVDIFQTFNPAIPWGIAAGVDGNIWFAEYNSNAVGRITPSGDLTEFPLTPRGTVFPAPVDVVSGPDGTIYSTLIGFNSIGQVSLHGVLIRSYALPTAAAGPLPIAMGPDNNIWFTETQVNKIGKLILGPSPSSQQPQQVPTSRLALIILGSIIAVLSLRSLKAAP